MPDSVATWLRNQVGITNVADLGTVYRGRLGAASYEIVPGIEEWQGTFFVRIVCRVSRGSGFSRIRVVKWPFSHGSAGDLERTIRDFHALENPEVFGGLKEERSGFGRLVDRLIGRQVVGVWNFLSPLEHPGRISIRAEVCSWGGKKYVTLAERRPGVGSILVQLPYESVSAIRMALETFGK